MLDWWRNDFKFQLIRGVRFNIAVEALNNRKWRQNRNRKAKRRVNLKKKRRRGLESQHFDQSMICRRWELMYVFYRFAFIS